MAHNAVVQRHPWQSEAATRMSGGGSIGPGTYWNYLLSFYPQLATASDLR